MSERDHLGSSSGESPVAEPNEGAAATLAEHPAVETKIGDAGPVQPPDTGRRRHVIRTWWATFRVRIALLTVLALGIFAGGVGTGWWAADRFSPRSAPDLVVVAAGTPPDAESRQTMPDVRGLTVDVAKQVLSDSGLSGVTVRERERPWVGVAGRVIEQQPVGGQPVTGEVILTVSAPAVIPAVVGGDVTEAMRALQALGAAVVVHRVYDGTPADRVLDVKPPAGQPVPPRVELTASAPPATMDLVELRPVSSNCFHDENVIVSGTNYPTALICRGGEEFASAVFLLGRRTAELRATLGQPDTSEPGSRVLMEIVADGRTAARVTLAYGESRTVTVKTTGVLRVEFRARPDPPPTGFADRAPAAFAGVTLVGGGGDLLELRGLRP